MIAYWADEAAETAKTPSLKPGHALAEALVTVDKGEESDKGRAVWCVCVRSCWLQPRARARKRERERKGEGGREKENKNEKERGAFLSSPSEAPQQLSYALCCLLSSSPLCLPFVCSESASISTLCFHLCVCPPPLQVVVRRCWRHSSRRRERGRPARDDAAHGRVQG